MNTELFEKAKAAYGTGAYDDATLEFLFPQLKESEDEQALRIIKKRMCYDPVPISDEDRRIVENWLEKQKPIVIQVENPNIQKLDPNVVVETRTDGTNPNVVNGSLTYQPVEWSEEDEKRINAVVDLLENTSAIHPNYSRRKLIIWLKDLRPKTQWKPSEEQMAMLQAVLNDPNNAGAESCQLAFRELYEQLKQLI